MRTLLAPLTQCAVAWYTSPRVMGRCSSTVEQGTHKPLVGGSNPPTGTRRAARLAPLAAFRHSFGGHHALALRPERG